MHDINGFGLQYPYFSMLNYDIVTDLEGKPSILGCKDHGNCILCLDIEMFLRYRRWQRPWNRSVLNIVTDIVHDIDADI
jgi:hypothetical protein